MELSDKDIIINKDDLLRKHELIGHGDEGLVFNYNNKYAVKIFKDYDRTQLTKLKLKLMKLKEMMKVKEEGCCLPLGFVSFDGENVHGVYSHLVKHSFLFDFNSLNLIKQKDRVKYLLEGDSILRRIHDKGFIVGDIKPDNILIDEDNSVKYIDCDNYKYGHFLFDTIPTRAGFYFRVYGHDLAYKDNDKLIYAIMSLGIITGDIGFNLRQDHEGLRRTLKSQHFTRDVEEVLEDIISPKLDKPYIGDVLPKMLIKK